MVSSPQVLVACSDAVHRDDAVEIVRGIGLRAVTCSSLADAQDLAERQTFQFILCGDDLPDSNMRTSIRFLVSSTVGVPVIVLSRLADWDAYMRALNAGAFDHIVCPPDPVEAERIVRRALEQNPPPRRASRTAA